MTLQKLLKLLSYIEGVNDVRMHGSCLYANGGGELTLAFNTQLPQSLDKMLRNAGFIVEDGEYIYRPPIRNRPPTVAMIRSATIRTK